MPDDGESEVDPDADVELEDDLLAAVEEAPEPEKKPRKRGRPPLVKKKGATKKAGAAAKKKGKKSDAKDVQDTTAVAKTPEKVFSLKDISMEIPKGQLTAIVGPVGTGKTSVLEALIGEMRRTHGTVKFQGSVAYCPQSAWIQVSELHLWDWIELIINAERHNSGQYYFRPSV